MQASTLETESQEILSGLIDIITALKRRAGERENPATVFLLRHLRASAPRRVSDLAECSRLDVSTVSRHVKSLEEAGYITRIEDPDDRRACLLKITKQGQSLYDAAMRARSAALDRGLADWTDTDRHALAVLVTRAARSLNPSAETRSST